MSPLLQKALASSSLGRVKVATYVGNGSMSPTEKTSTDSAESGIVAPESSSKSLGSASAVGSDPGSGASSVSTQPARSTARAAASAGAMLRGVISSHLVPGPLEDSSCGTPRPGPRGRRAADFGGPERWTVGGGPVEPGAQYSFPVQPWPDPSLLPSLRGSDSTLRPSPSAPPSTRGPSPDPRLSAPVP